MGDQQKSVSDDSSTPFQNEVIRKRISCCGCVFDKNNQPAPFSTVAAQVLAGNRPNAAVESDRILAILGHVPKELHPPKTLKAQLVIHSHNTKKVMKNAGMELQPLLEKYKFAKVRSNATKHLVVQGKKAARVKSMLIGWRESLAGSTENKPAEIMQHHPKNFSSVALTARKTNDSPNLYGKKRDQISGNDSFGSTRTIWKAPPVGAKNLAEKLKGLPRIKLRPSKTLFLMNTLVKKRHTVYSIPSQYSYC